MNFPLLIGTMAVFGAAGAGLYYWRVYQVRQHAFVVRTRAENLADEHKFAAAMASYGDYLLLRPDDGDARLRLAELFDKANDGAAINRAVELYRAVLGSSSTGLAAEKRIEAQRRITELLIDGNALDQAQNEADTLVKMEKDDLADKPEQWHGPGLRAVVLAGKFCDNNATVAVAEVEAAFARVLNPDKKQPKVFVAPEVYLAHYRYKVQRGVREAKDPGATAADYLAASNAVASDLDSAVNLAPDSRRVLLMAAAEAASVGGIADRAIREREASSLNVPAFRAAAYSQAVQWYQRAVKADPADGRAYLGLGSVFTALGNPERAIQIWQRGLSEVDSPGARMHLQVDLADGLMQQGRLTEAEKVLKDLNDTLPKLAPQVRLAVQRRVDLENAKLAFRRNRFEEVIHLATDLASGKLIVQGEETAASPQMRYEAWMLIGSAQVALEQEDLQSARRDVSSGPSEAAARLKQESARRHSEEAVAAFEQAAALAHGEAEPLVRAAESCRAVGRRDKAIEDYQRALAVVNAMKAPPAGLQFGIYDALIALSVEQKRPDDANRYAARRMALIVDSVQLSAQAMNLAIRDGRLGDALALGQHCAQVHPDDPLAILVSGRAEQANKHRDKAAAAYRKALQLVKNSPERQMQLASALLATTDPGDAAEGERALRDLLPRYPAATLQLVTYLAGRQRYGDALAVANSGVRTYPKDAIAHIAMGTAWRAKKDNAKAEAEFQEAVRLAPDAISPSTFLLDFYMAEAAEEAKAGHGNMAAGRTKLARDTFDKLLANVKLSDVDRELVRADMLSRLGDRKEAGAAFRKAAQIANDDPPVTMRLAMFLLNNHDAEDDAEAERLLRQIAPRHEPARRLLAGLLIGRGGEADWEEGLKFLEQSAGDPAFEMDRVAEIRLLMRRRGDANLEKAAGIAEELLAEAKQQPTHSADAPDVLLLLAQIRELQGKVDAARKLYVALATDPHAPRSCLTSYAEFLLRHGPAEEAEQRLAQLEKLTPNDLTVLQLRSRWLRSQNRSKEIEPLIDGRMSSAFGLRAGPGVGDEKVPVQPDKKQSLAVLARAVGDVYLRLELYAAAERWYRRALQLGAEVFEPLAAAITMQGRIREAVALCLETAKHDESLRPALTLAGVLGSSRAAPQDLEMAEPYLKKIADAHKDQADLLNCMASIRIRQDRPAEAIELYRQVLRLRPKDLMVLNNLATLLSEQPEPESRNEALEYIDRAIDLLGPQPGFLDTKGMALFYSGKAEQAMEMLQTACGAPNADPRFRFHLAAAYARLDQLDKARAALRKAREGNLEQLMLTKKDHQLLADLDKQLEK